MCGLAGAITHRPSESVSAADAALHHRGPDDGDTLTGALGPFHLALVHRRLAIVDLTAAGRQPMANEDGTLHMVFNGEIYNFAELRAFCEARGHRFTSAMDGEVILHLWEIEGSAALARLNGIFAVAIADTRTGELWLARDPMGVKPLYYATGPGNELWFASEIRALAAIGAPATRPDPVALAQFLTFLWVPDPRSPVEGVHTVPPGQLLRWRPDGVRLTSYGPAPWEPGTAEVEVDEFEERFVAAARRQLLADVPLGLMASGGLDSSLIWWANRNEVSRSFCISWEGWTTDEGIDEDAAAVKQLQARFGTATELIPGDRATPMEVPPSGDLFADPAYELTRCIAAAAAEQGYKVLFSGQGGDELLGGYRRHWVSPVLAAGQSPLLRPAAAMAERILGTASQSTRTEYGARIARGLGQGDAFRGYMQLCSYSTPEDRARALDCTVAEVTDDVVWQHHREAWDRLPPHLSLRRKVMLLDMAVYLPGLGLAYADRAGMEFGVEVRVPWLDLDLVRWCLALPEGELFHRGVGKQPARAVAERHLGTALAHRAKRGFAAPKSMTNRDGLPVGRRGFRQGAYFARAESVLHRWLEEAPLSAAG